MSTAPVVAMVVPVTAGTAVVAPPFREYVGNVRANPASAKSTVTVPQWLILAAAGVSIVTVPTEAEAVASTTVAAAPIVGVTVPVPGSSTSVLSAVPSISIHSPKSISAVFATVIAVLVVNVTGTFTVVCAKASLIAAVEPIATMLAHANSFRVLRFIIGFYL